MKLPSWKDACIYIFAAAVFTIAKTKVQTNYPPKDDWVKKMWYI